MILGFYEQHVVLVCFCLTMFSGILLFAPWSGGSCMQPGPAWGWVVCLCHDIKAVRPRVSDKISSQPLPQPRSPSRTGPKASSAPLRPPTNKQPSKPASGFRAFSEDFASAMKHAGEQEPVDVSGEVRTRGRWRKGRGR